MSSAGGRIGARNVPYRKCWKHTFSVGKITPKIERKVGSRQATPILSVGTVCLGAKFHCWRIEGHVAGSVELDPPVHVDLRALQITPYDSGDEQFDGFGGGNVCVDLSPQNDDTLRVELALHPGPFPNDEEVAPRRAALELSIDSDAPGKRKGSVDCRASTQNSVEQCSRVLLSTCGGKTRSLQGLFGVFRRRFHNARLFGSGGFGLKRGDRPLL